MTVGQYSCICLFLCLFIRSFTCLFIWSFTYILSGFYIYSFTFLSTSFFHHPEDRGSKALRNVVNIPQHYMASQHRWPWNDSLFFCFSVYLFIYLFIYLWLDCICWTWIWRLVFIHITNFTRNILCTFWKWHRKWFIDFQNLKWNEFVAWAKWSVIYKYGSLSPCPILIYVQDVKWL
jgi:hypothetical protein